MIALLSPAKTLDFDQSRALRHYTRPALLDDASELARVAGRLRPDQLGDLMDINGELASLNAERFDAWRADAHEQPGESLQAIRAFRGEVYRGLDADSLNAAQLEEAQHRVRILSGLYGILRPLDLMLPYRLEMGTRLSNPRGESLYAFWGTRIAEQLNREVQNEGADILLNLASQEYFRAVPEENLAVPVVTPQFKDRRNGKLRTVAVYAKRQRGRMARFLVTERPASVRDLRDYHDDGYRFSPADSDDRVLTFVRES